MTVAEKQASMFGLLADPTRLKLLKLLAQQREPNALCVNALAFKLGITQSAVSQHLRIMKSAGLVNGERRGCSVHYYLDRDAFGRAKECVFAAIDFTEETGGGKGIRNKK